ncbi:MAG TPA: ATP synthase F1 subunit epsilon [bacterium]|nr:ATP synthase F1 subunit epsilon [bacterium]
MAATLKLEIVTPEAMVYSDDVEMVSLTGIDGDMGIYPDHMPLMTQLVAGEIIARKNATDISLAVGDGFIQVTKDRVAILTDMAVKLENIDEVAAEQAKKKAEARLQQKLSDEEAATVQASLAHATALLKVKQRHKK